MSKEIIKTEEGVRVIESVQVERHFTEEQVVTRLKELDAQQADIDQERELLEEVLEEFKLEK